MTLKVINADCLIELKKYPDKYFDLILTDPPYGIGESNEKNQSRENLAKCTDFGHYDWDNKIPDKEYFDEMLRVSKNQIIFGGNYFVEYLHNSSCWIIWDKDNFDNDFADCEIAWTSFSSAIRKFKWRWCGMLQERMNWKEKRLHPTQKPLELFRWILKKYAKSDDKICDPFCGSGTTIVACKQLGIDCVAIDINPEYVKIANKRLKQEVLI